MHSRPSPRTTSTLASGTGYKRQRIALVLNGLALIAQKTAAC